MSAKFDRYTVYQQYLLIKTSTRVFCLECSETQVATSSMIINANSMYSSLWCTFFQLHQVVRNIQTTLQSSQYCTNKPVYYVAFAARFCAVSRWLQTRLWFLTILVT